MSTNKNERQDGRIVINCTSATVKKCMQNQYRDSQVYEKSRTIL